MYIYFVSSLAQNVRGITKTSSTVTWKGITENSRKIMNIFADYPNQKTFTWSMGSFPGSKNSTQFNRRVSFHNFYWIRFCPIQCQFSAHRYDYIKKHFCIKNLYIFQIVSVAIRQHCVTTMYSGRHLTSVRKIAHELITLSHHLLSICVLYLHWFQ